MTAEILDTPAVVGSDRDATASASRILGLFQRQSRRRRRISLVIVVVVLVAILADVIAPHSPYLTDTTVALKPPFWQAGGSLTYPLGTDPIGRDILSRLIYGSRLSLMIGIAVVSISIVIGTVLGLVAGFVRGITEIFIMRLMDIILTLPSLLLAIVIVAVLGPWPDELDARRRARHPAALRAPRPRRRHHRDVEGLCDGRPRQRRRSDPADVQGSAAQLHRAADRPGVARHFHGDPRRRRPRLSRPRRAAARRPNGAPCWPMPANSCCAPGGS